MRKSGSPRVVGHPPLFNRRLSRWASWVYRQLMSLVRTILVWLCSVAMLATTTLSHGHVWCRTADGSVTLEPQAVDGRCAHLTIEDSAPDSSADVSAITSVRAVCQDFSLGRTAHLAQAGKLVPQRAASVAPSASTLHSGRHGRPPTSAGRNRLSPYGPALFPTGSAFVRETVVLLV